MHATASPRLSHFSAGESGTWEIRTVSAIRGEGLQIAPRLDVSSSMSSEPHIWTLCGTTSNERYVTRDEKNSLVEKQEGLGRDGSSCAVLIPIKKSSDWWMLTQDERRGVLETQSRHIAIGLEYLPAVARKLHHCRDLSVVQPFDFLTWFEFAPSQERSFNELLHRLRSSPEWTYVEREVEIRLERVT